MSGSQELLEMRFKRFLHYGSEMPVYKTGDRFYYKCYSTEHTPSLLKLINGEKAEMIVDIIVKVKNDETSLWPDSLTFALAVCAHQETSVPLQQSAYKAIRIICKKARDIILFVKFYRDLKENKGGGNGFKRAVAQWYLVWMPFDLADILLQQRSYHGWKHTDVLRVAHIKPVSIEQQLLFTYATRGLGEAKKRFGDCSNEQVVELLDYITSVENFRKIKDVEKAAKAVALELHNIERIPSHLLKHQEVWNELIPNMDVKTLLDNLQRISIQGYLKNNNVTVMKVVDVLNSVWKAETFKGHPSRVFIELMTYEKAAKYCLDIASKMNHPISKMTPAKKPPKCNLLIKNALITYFYSLFKFQKPTGLRYLVAVDVRPKMYTDRCLHCMHMTPIEAAQVVCLSLVRTEAPNNVKIGAFVGIKGGLDVSSYNAGESFRGGIDFEVMAFNKDAEHSEYETWFNEKTSKAGPASVASAIHWAEVNKKQIDVFVILSNYMVNTCAARPAITKYRSTMKMPNSKVITCSFSGNIRTHKDVEGQNMYCIVGFDEHVCRAIEAFARGAF